MTTLTAAPLRSLALGTEEAVFIGRSLRHSLRNPEALLMTVMLPVILMFLFTIVFGGSIDQSGGYVNYVVPGIVLLCAGFGAASTAVEVAGDMQNGVIDRFRTMPIRSWAVLTGHVVGSLVRNLTATTVVLAVALLVGFRPSAAVSDWAAALGVVALYILAVTYLFAAIGLAARSATAANSYGFILLFLPYLSSAFVRVDTLPEWLRWVADNQPITPVIETLRHLLLGGDIEHDLALALLWCTAILMVSVIWAAASFRGKGARR